MGRYKREATKYISLIIHYNVVSKWRGIVMVLISEISKKRGEFEPRSSAVLVVVIAQYANAHIQIHILFAPFHSRWLEMPFLSTALNAILEEKQTSIIK